MKELAKKHFGKHEVWSMFQTFGAFMIIDLSFHVDAIFPNGVNPEMLLDLLRSILTLDFSSEVLAGLLFAITRSAFKFALNMATAFFKKTTNKSSQLDGV